MLQGVVVLRRAVASAKVRTLSTSAVAYDTASSSSTSSNRSGFASRSSSNQRRNGVQRTRKQSVLQRDDRSDEERGLTPGLYTRAAPGSTEQKRKPEPIVTDWNDPRYARAAPDHHLFAPPREFVYDVEKAAAVFAARAPAQPKAQKTAAAPADKSKGGKPAKGAKASAPAAAAAAPAVPKSKSSVIRLLPGHKEATRALSLHLHRSASSAPASSGAVSLHEELKAARQTAQNEKIGGDYSRYNPDSVLATVSNAKEAHKQVLADASQAVAQNSDLSVESKQFLVNTIAARLTA